jgi:signal transduction histidine kinase
MEETKRLTLIVNDLLELSKLESEIGRLDSSVFSLTESVEATVERMNELLKTEGFEISFEYGESVAVKADKPKLERALYNLLINAVNYSGESKSVAVKQTVSENTVRISVADCGEGISEEELPFIWYRYYKSGKTHRRGVAGLGLGLSIVKRIMELHGGKYGVESELDRGSTFWFELKR